MFANRHIGAGDRAISALRIARAAQMGRLLHRSTDLLSDSLAWPGASPLLSRGSTAEQLSLFLDLFAVAGGAGQRDGDDIYRFDPTPFSVRQIAGRNQERTIGQFLAANHYAGGAGMKGSAAFGLYFLGGPRPELVGVCTFAREGNPWWAKHTFHPLERDVDDLRAGRISEQALRHMLVNESEYLVLNRLAIVDRDRTQAPLGKGAASWFVARCLLWLEMRNRLLWSAITAKELGYRVTTEQEALIAEARLDEPNKGLAFVKAISTQADVWEGHIGHIYQVLRFHYLGRTNGGRWTTDFPGTRSGQRISRRTIEKAHKAGHKGHDTAVLRLIWEGGEGLVRIRRGDDILEESDAHWIREVHDEGLGIQKAITPRWRAFQKAMRDRHGADIEFETAYLGGGVVKQKFPSKHAYLLGLGAQFWRHQVEVRCKHLTERLLALDAEWLKRGWGPRLDNRTAFYPKEVTPEEMKPELRSRVRLDAA